MAYSNPEHYSDSRERFMDYTKKYPPAIVNSNPNINEVKFMDTPLEVWTRIGKWCKTQNITVRQLADSLEKQE